MSLNPWKVWLKRWRNSHGFGVHSPFGFQLTQLVVSLKRGYAYYAEEEIANKAAELPRNSNRRKLCQMAILIHRLLNFYPPQRAILSAAAREFNPLLEYSITSAGTPIVKDNNDLNLPSFTAALGSEMEWNQIQKSISAVGSILFLINAPSGIVKQLQSTPNLLIISGQKNLLIIHRPQMQTLLYHMYIG